MFGIGNFSAVINPPQACILAVSASIVRTATSQRLDLYSDETSSSIPSSSSFSSTPVSGTFMNVTLSYDERVLDASAAGRWVKQFRYYLENPQSMLL
jgi:pyruvate/2-oxoglutarate dehydrogenase complex dihydrolipoamide acyltransferase (E2) component